LRGKTLSAVRGDILRRNERNHAIPIGEIAYTLAVDTPHEWPIMCDRDKGEKNLEKRRVS